ncbi:MAG: relaxase MobL [Acidobacteria bacterium]|nr:relaxase MobL [Acidobacteriota bacterium]
MRVIVSVKPTPGGGETTQATRYIAYRERDEEREGKEPRPLFSASEDNLSFWKAERVLTEGRTPAKDELIHVVVSFREDDFQALGKDETKRQDALKVITRESVSRIADELKTDGLIWAAGIHRNTDNPHIHLLINRNYVDRETGRERRLVRLPEEMLAGRETDETGVKKINPGSFGLAFENGLDRMQKKARAENPARAEAAMNMPATHSDEMATSGNEKLVTHEEKLLEAARRNPSIAGQELVKEIILRGAGPESDDRLEVTDISNAFRTRSIDDPEYRTQPEHADWLGRHSQELRDLYERGADIKGDVFIIPTEEFELPEDRDQPFITNLSYARQQIQNPEIAIEFHTLAKTIAGQTADPKTEIEVFRYYYDRIREDRSVGIPGDLQSHRDEVLERTLDEMRSLADEMAGLETRKSIEIAHSVVTFEGLQEADRADKNEGEELSLIRYEHLAEDSFALTERDEEIDINNDRKDAIDSGNINTAARKIGLRDESLRFPASLSFETREKLVTRTLPAIDRLLETGRDRTSIHAGIDLAIYNHDSPEYNEEESRKIGGFLKSYVDERLRDPETRALNSSPAFRSAQAKITSARTPEEINHVAENFLRENLQRTNSFRLHQIDPNRYSKPEEMPLNARERNLLFFGRAPEHHTAEMRELRHAWGLSRVERAERIEALREGRLAPSDALEKMFQELESRQTYQALNHYQAAIINEEMRNPGKLNLRQMYERLPPHERTYLIQEIEERKRVTTSKKTPVHEIPKVTTDRVTTGRAFGAAPRESSTYREYLASMGAIEQQLLNEAVHQREIRTNKIILDKEEYQLSINEARALLPPQEQIKIRNQARNLAWESITPPEVFATQPTQPALRLSDTVAHIQEGPQQRARLAHQVLDGFIKEKLGANDGRDKLREEMLGKLTPTDARRLKELEDYAARTREELYRGFESLDALRREFDQTRITNDIDRNSHIVTLNNSEHSRALVMLSERPMIEQVSRLANGGYIHPNSNSTVAGETASQSDNRDQRTWQIDSDQRWHFDSLPPPPEVIATREFNAEIKHDDIEHELTFER